MSRVHGVFSTDDWSTYSDGQVDATPFNPKQVIYQYLTPSTVAYIGYFDVNSEPQQVDGARLPWSLKITTTLPAIVGDTVAQCGRDSIGCRIVVDGVVKAERVPNDVHAYTHWLVKAA
jgi:hypothetical protein